MAQGNLLIVSTPTEEDGIFVFRIADGDGRLELVRQTKGMKNPFYIALHPNGEVLYSIVDPDEEGLVAAMAFDRESGSLQFINQQTTRGDYPCYVDVDASGRALVAANYGSGSVISFPIGEGGALGEAGSFYQHEGSGVNESSISGPRLSMRRPLG